MSAQSTSRRNNLLTRGDAPLLRRRRGELRPRTGRRVLTPMAGMVFAAALMAGCGSGTEEPADPEDTVAEETQEEGPPTEDATDGGQSDGDEGGTTDPGEGDPEEGTDDEPGEGTDDEPGEEPGEDENLFEGSWHMGHHEKVLTADELAAVLEEEALARGPDEMHLTVECEDGVDAPAGDTEARCVAIGDEGALNPWAITALPADAGLEIEVENTQ